MTKPTALGYAIFAGAILLACSPGADEPRQGSPGSVSAVSAALALVPPGLDDSDLLEPEESVALAADGDGVVRQAPAVLRRSYSGRPFPYLGKPGAPTAPARAYPTEVERLRAAAGTGGDMKLTVTFFLAERPFSWADFRRVRRDDSARSQVVAARKADLVASQAEFRSWLLSVGASDIQTYFSVNHLTASVPASQIEAALGRHDVLGGALPEVARPSLPQTGEQIKDYVRATDLYANSIRGQSGSKATGLEIRMGILEVASASTINLPLRNHPVFKRAAPSNQSRIIVEKDCSSGTCVSTTYVPSALRNHGSDVAALAAGSIEGGQDAAFPGSFTSDQRQRSGVLIGSNIFYYYGGGNSVPIKAALDTAIQDGVDVINMSFWIGVGNTCNPFANPSGFNASIRSAAAAGTVTIASAGNDPSSTCNIDYPSFRPEVLAVTQLDPDTAAPVYPSYDATQWAGLSMGGLPISLYGSGTVTTTSAMGLVSPGCIGYSPSLSGGVHSYVGTGECGTSYAAPVVSGVVGAMRQGFAVTGYPLTSGRLMTVNALMMGDGYDYDWGVSVHTPTGMSSKTGAGRIRAHWTSSNDLGLAWGWGWHNPTIYGSPNRLVGLPA